MTLKLLFFGDIMGRIGRRGVAGVLAHWKDQHRPDLVIANVENLAHGKGVTKVTLEEIRAAGVTVYTSGNHIFKKPEVYEIIDDPAIALLRPANYPPGAHGRGTVVVDAGGKKVLVINLLGRVYMNEHTDCPFRTVDAILEEYKDVTRAATIVDIHAEATSEKVALGLYLDGRVSAVLGTHTHVPTADAEVLPRGTAYLTDVGMTGGKGTVLGVDKVNIIENFLTQEPRRHEIPESGTCVVNAVLVTIDAISGKATEIKQLREEVEV
ncbi:metallophosphoesterase [Candidatus Uhrbacteria bacterium CG10_big_fil_rev_8_21_14_0_10_48_11]|uniref:Metallophosphoesterase n=1 Tax=Candidatus Uhrbacteria bacterium CG10_big_fil_rev_8_21_14_0_10_48_11 TaxID=1975037 RepID=A0A2M8LFV6_9BACT|nr:MAG: metallophosphoesterase [Candidatus Uhrbacteria bacterium CG10_big_fil_rev_8_21_14_0_10_48_11]